MLKKILFLSLIGIGVYLLLTRKAHAEEISAEIPIEISTTPSAPENPAINMVDQIIKELKEIVTSASQPQISMTPEECLRQLPEWIVYSKGIAPITDPCGMLKRMKEQGLL